MNTLHTDSTGNIYISNKKLSEKKTTKKRGSNNTLTSVQRHYVVTFMFLVYLLESPIAHHWERNVVYIPIITLKHATSVMSK